MIRTMMMVGMGDLRGLPGDAAKIALIFLMAGIIAGVCKIAVVGIVNIFNIIIWGLPPGVFVSPDIFDMIKGLSVVPYFDRDFIYLEISGYEQSGYRYDIGVSIQLRRLLTMLFEFIYCFRAGYLLYLWIKDWNLAKCFLVAIVYISYEVLLIGMRSSPLDYFTYNIALLIYVVELVIPVASVLTGFAICRNSVTRKKARMARYSNV